MSRLITLLLLALVFVSGGWFWQEMTWAKPGQNAMEARFGKDEGE